MSSQTTICTCIEAGLIEKQVLLMVRSLRALDGPLSKVDVLAIQPRPGPAISVDTRRQLASLGVEYIHRNLMGSYAWFDHLTKAAAMAWAERQVSTRFLTWIDGDFVFVRHPDAMIPDGDFSFIGAPGEADLGTDGSDANAQYWHYVADLLEVPLDSGIIMPAGDNGKLIMEYYNGGVYTLACDEGISAAHFKYFKLLLDKRIAARSTGSYFNDMVALAMAARGARGPRLVYGLDMNFHLQPSGYRPYLKPYVTGLKLLHYHGSFFRPTPAVEAFIADLPREVGKLIQAHLPLRINDMRIDRRVRRKLTTILREKRVRRFNATCTYF